MKIKSIIKTFAILFIFFALFQTTFAQEDDHDDHHDDDDHVDISLMHKALNSIPMGGNDNDFESKLDELQDKIKEYESKIKELQGQEATLQREIDVAQTQINLTNARIQNTLAEINRRNNQIDVLENEISVLIDRLDNISDRMVYQETVLNERLRARYKISNSSPFLVVFSSNNVNEAVLKSQYLKVMQIQDKKLLDNMNATKNIFGQQKYLSEVKKDEIEEIRVQIEKQYAELEVFNEDLKRQQESKKALLEKTENDEQKFQTLLAQVQSELAALAFAINLPEGEGVEVKKGDIIGLMGNTGCSTGPHLHFGYVKNGTARDPLPLLENGKLKWPVKNWAITQYFGANYSFYMNNFGIPGHDALDIISTSQWSGAPILAAKDGELYYRQDSKVYCPWLNNSLGKGAVIDHGNGERTIYWHLQ